MLLLVVPFLVGCGSPPPRAVTGTVLVNNVPTSGVYVVLHSADGNTAGSGCSGEDGSVRLTVPRDGEYAVTCYFPKVTKVMDDYIVGDDQFHGRYRNFNMPVTKVVIKSGDNSLPPIQLMP